MKSLGAQVWERRKSDTKRSARSRAPRLGPAAYMAF